MASDKDFNLAGIPSTSTVQSLLDTAEDPPQAIAAFQAANGLSLPSLKPVLKVLDLHGVRRHEYHTLVFNSLSDKLLERIRELGADRDPASIKKLEAQLERCFRLHHIPKLRPIVLETLNRLPKVSSKILKKIIDEEELYAECSMGVKQQIWHMKTALFASAVEPLLDSYIDEKERILTSVSRGSSNYFTVDTTKSRRQWRQVKELTAMIGTHDKLFSKLISILSTKYTETGSFHYASLRVELEMSLHDINVDFVSQIEPCHDLVWCLDACGRDRHLDVQQAAKLKALLDKRKFAEEHLRDMSLILADPFSVHFLCTTTIKVLCDNARSCSSIPRENTVLHILVRLLSLGISALRINEEGIRDQKTVVDVSCLTRFLPLLSEHMANDFFRQELHSAPNSISEEYASDYSPQPPGDALLHYITTNAACALLWLHYVAELLETMPPKLRVSDAVLLSKYVRAMCRSKDEILMHEPWSHLLTHRLLNSPAHNGLVANETFTTTVIDEYYTPAIKQDANNRFHLLRICTTYRQSLSDELVERAAQVIRMPLEAAAFVGQSSAQRFDFELVRLGSSLEARNERDAASAKEPMPYELDAAAMSTSPLF